MESLMMPKRWVWNLVMSRHVVQCYNGLMPFLCSCFLCQVKFGPAQTNVELVDLMPSTDYSVTLYALYDEDPSDPITAIGTTCKYRFIISIDIEMYLTLSEVWIILNQFIEIKNSQKLINWEFPPVQEIENRFPPPSQKFSPLLHQIELSPAGIPWECRPLPRSFAHSLCSFSRLSIFFSSPVAVSSQFAISHG